MSKLKIMVAGSANPHVPGYLRGAGQSNSLVNLVAVSDFDAARLNRDRDMLAAKPDVAFYTDYQEMLASHPEAEAVIIGSDNRDHFEMFKAAVERRLHIYMMKVISMNEDECREMVAIGDTYPRVIQCELELHFNPQFQYARKIIQSGVLGDITSIYLTNISQSPCNYFLNWGDPLLSYGSIVPIRPGARTYRGGALTDHPHPFDLIRWLTGREFAAVRAMSAENQRSHLAVEDHVAITGTLDNGVICFINPSYTNLEEQVATRRLLWPKALECNLKVTGTKGYFACDYFDRHSYIVGSNYVSPNRLIVDGTPRLSLDPMHSLLGCFTDCISGKRSRPETTLADSFAAIRVMNAAYKSISLDAEVTLS
ncbi:MAG TPA: Gfo/Idh/MocA family oxidoreductase [Lentisphaeria bacterium]|nr:Gfo/Idh/MocA family oxidoreductase [Lentisphaerota bacterium]OQC17842.1 MAG: Inositol 2-dehydrogenase/D-chiro-inositol 3-dehydrogenase [Lentisphaerae bacterium ADurb.Bin082]HPY91465.1 Gfo/Idh/MocA family oxidoreductase [Lentisphaeria bacterium]HQL88269.1 Gfo/Idh/MocA family oxidoreductase [Lentisphaeria bacterium]